MSKTKYTYSIVITAVIAFCVSIGMYYYTRSPYEESGSPHVKISASALLETLRNESKSFHNYIEKPIAVTGVVEEITYLNGVYAIFLEGIDESHVLCEMRSDQTEVISKISENDLITIKGIYKGSLLDVILLNCTIISTKE